MKKNHVIIIALSAIAISGFMGHRLHAESTSSPKPTFLGAQRGSNTIDRVAQINGDNKILQFTFIGDQNTQYTIVSEDVMEVKTVAVYTGNQISDPFQGLWFIGDTGGSPTTANQSFAFLEDGRQQFNFDPPFVLTPGETISVFFPSTPANTNGTQLTLYGTDTSATMGAQTTGIVTK